MGGAGTGAVFDTNILIDSIRGVRQAQSEIERYDVRAISVISWIEVMAGIRSDEEEAVLGFLSQFELLPFSSSLTERIVHLRRDRRIKLPDAIILATAMASEFLLVTRNTRDFREEEGVVRIPYRL